ncbi:MAG TPA: polysaccharide deacetylase family protein [Pseudomonadota bacterium]|nr:polysaccharide deacetylase family protein [Pseudomonadota bacterium]HNK46391.1 polysaccharide deacetylase family protein [Pseudomonadota bacterium]
MSVKATVRGLVKRGLRQAVATAGMLSSVDESPRILCYHGVCDDPPDEWSVTPAQLRQQLAIVCGERNPVSLPQLMSWFFDGTKLPPRAVAITFDDGYQDVLRHAAPILAAHGILGAAFVISGLIDGKMRDDSYVPTRPLLSWDEVRELAAAGFAIGSHTLTHPILAQQSSDVVERELRESRQRLSDVLGQPIDLLAYPYGTRQTVSLRDRELAKAAGYQAAFLDSIGPLSRGQDRYALARCKVLGTDSLQVFRASLCGQLDLWRNVEDR